MYNLGTIVNGGVIMEKKVIDFLKLNNGYITTSELEKLGVLRVHIPKLIENDVLRKVARGLYIDDNLIEDEYYILQKRYNNVIYSHYTAFHLLNLSERAPYELEVTTYYDKRIRDSVHIHYVAKEKLDIGVITVQSPYGNPIKIYNAERCICDMLKNSKDYDPEQYSKILKNYFKSNHKNLKLLDEYAKNFKVYEKLTTIMEVLM